MKTLKLPNWNWLSSTRMFTSTRLLRSVSVSPSPMKSFVSRSTTEKWGSSRIFIMIKNNRWELKVPEPLLRLRYWETLLRTFFTFQIVPDSWQTKTLHGRKDVSVFFHLSRSCLPVPHTNGGIAATTPAKQFRDLFEQQEITQNLLEELHY